MEPATATLIAASIAGVISITALGGSIHIARLNLRHGEAKDFAKLSLEFKLRQVNELYGPLRHLLDQNAVLAKQIRVGKSDPEKWRLMDHLPGILDDPRDGAIAKAIVEIDSRIQDLITTKAGLVMGGVLPQSFTSFGSHYQLLKLAMGGMKISPTDVGYYYPRELDNEVLKGYTAISLEVHELMRKYEQRLREI